MSLRPSAPTRMFGLLASCLCGCLLRADPPIFTDDCANLDIKTIGKPFVITRKVADARDVYACGAQSAPDYVIEWTPGAFGPHSIRLESADSLLRLGLAEPSCGGEVDICAPSFADELEVDIDAFDPQHIVVEGVGLEDTEFQLTITPLN